VALLPTGILPKLMLDGLTVSCAVDTSEYRRMFSRTSPHPITLHGKPGCLTAWPFLRRANAARAGGYGATAPSIPAEQEGFSRLRIVKGAASAVFSECPKIGRSQKGMLKLFLVVVPGCPFDNFLGDYPADGTANNRAQTSNSQESIHVGRIRERVLARGGRMFFRVDSCYESSRSQVKTDPSFAVLLLLIRNTQQELAAVICTTSGSMSRFKSQRV
jgi:hypothetical protein